MAGNGGGGRFVSRNMRSASGTPVVSGMVLSVSLGIIRAFLSCSSVKVFVGV